MRPSLWQPVTGPSGHHDQQLSLGRVEQRAEHLAGGRIEPVHVLGHYQPGFASQTRLQIGPHRLRDQLVESSALGGHLLIARPRFDSQYRRQ